jgi:hypothetical protein
MLVVGALEDSPFQTRIEDYSGALRSGHRQTEERPPARELESERVSRISAVGASEGKAAARLARLRWRRASY